MSPHSVDDDRSGRAQEQGGHDDDGSQDDEDYGPDIQDVLGKQDIHRGLADSIHVGPETDRKGKSVLCTLSLPPSWESDLLGPLVVMMALLPSMCKTLF